MLPQENWLCPELCREVILLSTQGYPCVHLSHAGASYFGTMGITGIFIWIFLQNHWFTYNETMTVESVTQAVSNLALQFGEEDADPGAMVGSRGGSGGAGEPRGDLGVLGNPPSLSLSDPFPPFSRSPARSASLCSSEEWMRRDPSCEFRSLNPGKRPSLHCKIPRLF